MKSATYEIVGCRGSQSYNQTGEYDSMPDARKAARASNQQNADSLGWLRLYKEFRPVVLDYESLAELEKAFP